MDTLYINCLFVSNLSSPVRNRLFNNLLWLTPKDICENIKSYNFQMFDSEKEGLMLLMVL